MAWIRLSARSTRGTALRACVNRFPCLFIGRTRRLWLRRHHFLDEVLYSGSLSLWKLELSRFVSTPSTVPLRQASIIARISFSPDSEKAGIPRSIRSVTVTPRKARVSVFLRSSHRFFPGGGETCTLPLDTQVVEPKKPYVYPAWVIRH